MKASTSSVQLRDVIEADLPTLFEHQIDPVANKLAAFGPREREAFMAHWGKVLADETVVKQAILFGGRVAGNIACFERSGERLVGYWIGREYWGRGIATRALSEFLHRVTIRPLFARVAKRNPASLRVLEKCGFAPCGEDRGSFGFNGEEVEEWIMKLASSPTQRGRSDSP